MMKASNTLSTSIMMRRALLSCCLLFMGCSNSRVTEADLPVVDGCWTMPHSCSEHDAPSAKKDIVLTQVWRYKINAASANFLIERGVMYCMSRTGELHAVDASVKNGSRCLWKAGVSGRIGEWFSMAICGRLIIVCDAFKNCVAFDKNTGRRVWAIKLYAPAYGDAITVFKDKIYVQDINNGVYVIDTSGKMLMHVSVGVDNNTFVGVSAPLLYKDLVILGSTQGNVCAYRMPQGSLEWSEFVTPAATFLSNQLRASGVRRKNIGYFASTCARTIALDLAHGEVLWHADHGAYRTPVLGKNHMYLFTTSGCVVCLDLRDGSLCWSRECMSELLVDDSCYIVLCKNYVLCIDVDGYIAWLKRSDGTPVRTEHLCKQICSEPVVINNVMYLNHGRKGIIAYT